MKRFTGICGSCFNVNGYQPLASHSEQPLQPPSGQHMDYQLESPTKAPLEPPDSQSYLSDQSDDHEVLHVIKRNNAFSVREARFFPDGNLYSLVISFDSKKGTKMKLTIENKKFYEVDTKWQLRGNAVLSIDGLVVDFLWDLIRQPVKFSFRTRAFPLDGKAAGSSGGGNGNDDGEFDSDAEQWEDYEDIYLLEILGIEE
ncbi:hypothetical protein MA16_Dca004603 [Dendrobium catenatum]|uniref:Uncharacterized protein n=1 Tax=Dendrobium catenatum TaxID=906689 RepID=A0A2I0VNK3_9ASPA|nr:hypothetical protein MA16_Dca004603 [Dendrobium catenatum]